MILSAFEYECPHCLASLGVDVDHCICGCCSECCACGSECDCAACLARLESSDNPKVDELPIVEARLPGFARNVLGIALCASFFAISGFDLAAHAKNFGTIGQVYPIIEDDFLEMISAGFKEMEADGRMARIRSEAVDHVKARVERPVGAILPKAATPRSFTVDLSIRLERDLADQEGRIFARAGTRVNPLAYSRFNKRIVMIDGDDPDQVAFALSKGNELDTLIVLARGAPLELMRAHGRRFWFDADQQMLTKFGIQALPSVITRADPLMRIDEVPVGDRLGKESQ